MALSAQVFLKSPLLIQLPTLQPNVSGSMHRKSMVKASWASSQVFSKLRQMGLGIWKQPYNKRSYCIKFWEEVWSSKGLTTLWILTKRF